MIIILSVGVQMTLPRGDTAPPMNVRLLVTVLTKTHGAGREWLMGSIAQHHHMPVLALVKTVMNTALGQKAL